MVFLDLSALRGYHFAIMPNPFRSPIKDKTEPGSKSKSQGLKEKVSSLFWTLIVVLLIRALFIQAYQIPSGSMENTFLPGDFLLVAKFTYGIEIPYTHIKLLNFRTPRRGEVVVFPYPVDMRRDFVKRVIGLPGDTLQIINKRVYINGKPLEEPYAVHKDPRVFPPVFPVRDALAQKEFQEAWLKREFMRTERVRDNFGPIVVPEGTVFVMGDNRDYSLDSRFWGPVPIRLLKGTPLIIYFSWDSSGPFWKIWERIRWTRLFRPVFNA